MNNSNILLELKHVCLFANNKEILHNINLFIKQNAITTIIGPNGGGKTSLLKIICRTIQPTIGQVCIRPGTIIGYVPQNIRIKKTMPITVNNFLLLNTKIENYLNLKKHPEIFNRVHKLTDSYLYNISGGEMQYVLLAKALINNPSLLILDEPTSSMDLKSKNVFYSTIQKIRQETDCTIVIASHDLHVVMKSTDYVICINHTIQCSGKPEAENVNLYQLNEQKTDEMEVVYFHKHNK